MCMSTSFAGILNDAFIQFILINTGNNNFSMTASDNLVVWTSLKIWSPQKMFWWCAGRCSSKYACPIQILDKIKAAYNVSHYFSDSSAGEWLLICNSVIQQGYFLDILVTVSFFKVKMESESPLPGSPMIRIFVRTHKAKIWYFS